MKRILQRGIRGLMCLYLLNGCLAAHAQQSASKPPVNSDVFGKWPQLEDAKLSPDGKYVTYIVRNYPVGLNTMFIRAVSGSWERTVVCREFNYFSDLNNRYALYQKTGDSLAVVELGKDTRYYQNVSSFKLSGPEGNSIIGVQDKDGLFFLGGNGNLRLKNVQSFEFVLDGSAVLLKRSEGEEVQLTLVNIRSGKEQMVWKGAMSSHSFSMNEKRDKIIFLSGTPDRPQAVEYHDLRTGRHISARCEEPGLVLDKGAMDFTRTGESVILSLRDTSAMTYAPGALGLKVWSYKDDKSQGEQISDLDGNKTYRASFHIPTGKLKRLQLPEDREFWSSPKEYTNYALIAQTAGDCSIRESAYMNDVCKKTYYLLNVHTGERKKLDALTRHRYNGYQLSPDEKYVVFYDFDNESYFSYDIAADRLSDITAPVKSIFNAEKTRDAKMGYIPFVLRGIAGWMGNRPAVLLYDTYDIWEADLTGKSAPRCLTNGYGSKHKIQFFMPGERSAVYGNDEVKLLAFNKQTKDNGFFSMKPGMQKDPALLTMGPYMYYLDWGRVNEGGGRRPVKAHESDVYVVRRESSSAYPNYFATKDFKTFNQLTYFAPEKDYNWVTTELHTWQLPDGMQLQGVLYKPADFDPSKKYPIVFNYYESVSNALNDYLKPAALCNGCKVNPPLLASNGYLVFTPDIRYKADHAGKYAQMAVESAAKHLSQFSWVDTSRMGLQGCSWGGYETSYIAVHSGMFKAACTASGVTDPLTKFSNKAVNEAYYNIHWQHRFSSKPWENPEAFVEGSLLYHADKTRTPMLLMHTTIDDAVPFNQAMQFYLMLRVLQRPVWMLEYSGEGANHGLQRKEQAEDFSLRMLQFFDHYLKGKPAPKWMTDGVKAKDAVNELAGAK